MNALRNQLVSFDINRSKSEAKRKLAEFLVQADAFNQQIISKDLPQDEFQNWKEEFGKWFQTVGEWTQSNLGDTAAVRLADLQYQRTSIGKFINQEHFHMVNLVYKIKLNIEELIRNDAWNDFSRVQYSNKENG